MEETRIGILAAGKKSEKIARRLKDRWPGLIPTLEGCHLCFVLCDDFSAYVGSHLHERKEALNGQPILNLCILDQEELTSSERTQLVHDISLYRHSGILEWVDSSWERDIYIDSLISSFGISPLMCLNFADYRNCFREASSCSIFFESINLMENGLDPTDLKRLEQRLSPFKKVRGIVSVFTGELSLLSYEKVIDLLNEVAPEGFVISSILEECVPTKKIDISITVFE